MIACVSDAHVIHGFIQGTWMLLEVRLEVLLQVARVSDTHVIHRLAKGT